MNERIKELMAECNYVVDGTCDNTREQKFAELIVRECARIAFDESAHAGRMNKPGNCLFGTNIGRRIEKHFGVEK